MIRIARGPAPAYLSGPHSHRQYQQLAAHFQAHPSERGQQRPRWPTYTSEISTALQNAFFNKCAYCESQTDGSSIGLHRPRSNATGPDGTSPDHYWWFSLEWANMYLTCPACNRAKGSAFPVEGPRAPLNCPYEAIEESPLLIDPCKDDPEQILFYEDTGRVVSSNKRGFSTIELLHLNRTPLLERRRSEMERVRGRLSAVDGLLRDGSLGGSMPQGAAPMLSDLISLEVPHAGARRQVVRTWAGERNNQQIIGIFGADVRAFINSNVPRATATRIKREGEAHAESKSQRQATAPSRRDDAALENRQFIEHIELVNIRNIHHVIIKFPGGTTEAAPCLAILGENGVGKTTILQSIALALLSPQERHRLRLTPAMFLRHDADIGLIRVKLTGVEETLEVRMLRGKRRFEKSTPTPAVPVMAYGAIRLIPNRVNHEIAPEASRVRNLYKPRASLTNPADWLAKIENADWFRRTATSLKSLLPLAADDEIVRGPPVRLNVGGVPVDFGALSAGYQSILALSTDVMRFVAGRWGGMTAGELAASARGILIVDEIDAHLHPRWKMRVLADLRNFFPGVQMLVTTHDPLVLRGLERGEAVVLERADDGEIHSVTDLPSPKSLRIDQLLTSEYFGLISTRDQETDEQFRRYQFLLGQDSLTDGQNALLNTLRIQLDEKNLLGGDARERLYYRAIDSFIERRRAERWQSSPEANDEAIEQLLDKLWAETEGDQ